MRVKNLESRYLIVILVVLSATTLYGVGLATDIGTTPVEPQSVFTLYGAVLGYLFGSHEKKSDQDIEMAKSELEHSQHD